MDTSGIHAGWRRNYRNNPYNRGRARPMEAELPPAPEPAPQPAPPPSTDMKPLSVKSVDLKISSNVFNHHTGDYDITAAHHGDKARLVVRRGDTFDLDVICDRPMDDEKDRIQVVFQIGPSPRVGNGTEHSIRLKDGLKEDEFSGEVRSAEGSTVTLRLQTASSAIIGRWKITIRSGLAAREGSPTSEWLQYSLPNPIIILFNAWCEKDDVYMEDEIERDECVLNDTGKIWVGSAPYFVRPRAWNFGQFEKDILDCSLALLDLGRMGGLEIHARDDIKDVTRKLAAVVNSPDDNGVLVGNWSADYEGGVRPTKWQGSVKILQQYYKQKKPVKFGQCWVFAGVLTAVSRALGIPSRCVSNFSSAHDSDGSSTIDKYRDEDGKPISSMERDSIWNFHVWNEAFMKRPDLIDPKFSGWQAYDATPQETSAGIYTCGPCSVQAVKMGNVGLQYDARFVFAEVNADEVVWTREIDEDGNREFVARDDLNGRRDQTQGVGLMMSTKRPRKAKENPNEREDVTGNYKYPEGSAEEREAVERAKLKCKHNRPFAVSWRPQDVTFVTDELTEMKCGQDLVFKLKLANTNQEESRTVTVTMWLESVFNTGMTRDKVAESEQTTTLEPGQEGSLVLAVKEADVSKSLAAVRDQPNYRLHISGHVAPTSQIWFHEDPFVLSAEDCTVTGPAEMKVEEEYKITCSFVNPLPRALTNCKWQVEGPALNHIDDVKQGDVAPGKKAEVTVKVRYSRVVHETTILAQFECDQLPDVGGSHVVTVTI